MNILEANRELLFQDDSHPAKQFLNAFVDCYHNCVAREIALPGREPIDQAWLSAIDNKSWTFSSFAYTFLAFDVVLDGWLTNSPDLTESERRLLDALPMLRGLLTECSVAAHRDSNSAIYPLLTKTERMFDLWEQCIRARPRQRSALEKPDA